MTTLYYLKSAFVWISKKSVTFIPGVGQIMWLSGHILIDRKGKASIKAMYSAAKDRLDKGFSIFIFPQGTRERTKTLPFKFGAFNIAQNEQVDIVPVSLELSPNAWKRFFLYGYLWGIEEAKKNPGAILTVHKPMDIKKYGGENTKEQTQKMLNDAFDTVFSVLEQKKL